MVEVGGSPRIHDRRFSARRFADRNLDSLLHLRFIKSRAIPDSVHPDDPALLFFRRIVTFFLVLQVNTVVYSLALCLLSITAELPLLLLACAASFSRSHHRS